VGASLALGAALLALPSGGRVSAITNCDVGAAAFLLQEEQAIFDMMNAARRDAGLYELKPSPSLNQAAAWKSADQANRPEDFSHTDSLGRDPGQRLHDCGYAGTTIGENIGYGTPDPAVIFAAFHDSPQHWANIMNPMWRVAGVGYHRGQWTIDFGVYDDTGTFPLPPPSATPTTPGGSPPAGGQSPTPTATPTATPTEEPEDDDEATQSLQFDGKRAIAANLVVSN
jgi:hypothetical protein